MRDDVAVAGRRPWSYGSNGTAIANIEGAKVDAGAERDRRGGDPRRQRVVCWTAAVTKAWAGGGRCWARELAYDLPCMYNQACNAKRYREHLHPDSNVRAMAETVCRWPSVGVKLIRCV